MPTSKDPIASPLARELARSLAAHRNEIANVVALSLRDTPKWAQTLVAERANWDEFLRLQFHVFADYLAAFFAANDAAFKHLLVGELVKSLYDPSLDEAAAQAQARAVCRAQQAGLEALLRPQLEAAAWVLLEAHLAEVHAVLTVQAEQTQRVLLVGDCLFLDVVSFLVGALLAEGIRLVPDYATAKNPLALREELRRFGDRKFDRVFFSPFTYEFSAQYTQLLQWRRALMATNEVRRVVQAVWQDTEATLDLLADLFDGPIHVHNCSALVREDHGVKRGLKRWLTARVRALAKPALNTRLRDYVVRKNAQGLRHVFVLDEDRVVARVGEQAAGAYLYKSSLQHPAVLGRLLAPLYADILYVSARLAQKKVVVTDLDNTLWQGVIGEGEGVAHCHDRQRVLKDLRAKGVVLAIASKNDPAKVHWTGASLGEDDFVCAAISWEPKVQGLARIQDMLNVKMKDYVFIDDRRDERELVAQRYPEICCLDATDPRIWQRLALWCDGLDDDLEIDRTLMYKQRELRKAFVQDDVASEQDRTALFTSLQLSLTIAAAAAGDLKRVAELINRTNQFNLAGSRTNLAEVAQWHASPATLVLTGQTTDRFGDMGTTCIAVAQVEGAQMHLRAFVLSCRVFGYGIEFGVMNHLKRVAAQRGLAAIVGRFVATPHNQPCQSFLADCGFVAAGDGWRYTVGAAVPQDPGWLRVHVT